MSQSQFYITCIRGTPRWKAIISMYLLNNNISFSAGLLAAQINCNANHSKYVDQHQPTNHAHNGAHNDAHIHTWGENSKILFTTQTDDVIVIIPGVAVGITALLKIGCGNSTKGVSRMPLKSTPWSVAMATFDVHVHPLAVLILSGVFDTLF